MATNINEPQQTQLQSVFDLPGKSFQIVKKYWKLFAFANLPVLLLAVMSSLENKEANNKSLENINFAEVSALIGLGIITAIIVILVSLFFYVMVIKLSLEAVNNRPTTANELVSVAAKHWLRLLGLVTLMALIIGIGLVFLIIPGIIALVLLIFAPIILIDKNTSIVDALKGSFNLVSNNVGAVLPAILLVIGIAILTSIVNEIPFIGPILGTVISIAFSLVLFLRYQEIKNISKINSQV